MAIGLGRRLEPDRKPAKLARLAAALKAEDGRVGAEFGLAEEFGYETQPAVSVHRRDPEALAWHHGYKALKAALAGSKAPTGDLWDDVRPELVARLAASGYVCCKPPAALLALWRRRKGADDTHLSPPPGEGVQRAAR
jgi:hypothetical protein